MLPPAWSKFMKKILLSSVALLGLVSAASAADLPSRRPAPAPFIAAVPIFTWTGFYVGAQVGYAWGDNNNDIPGGAFVARGGVLVPFDGGFGGDNDGFLAGVHAGYNYQFGAFVAGVEGDIEGVFGDDNNNFNDVLFDRFGNVAAVS